MNRPAAADGAALIGPGVFMPVVGPSGSGKDSIMNFARQMLAGRGEVRFARRTITRPSDPASEAHDTLDYTSFRRAEDTGAFALSWRSHGLSYGIPAEVDEIIRTGGVVVANLSRGVIDAARARYANVVPVLVTVTPEVMRQRLLDRGRETAEQIEDRIARNAQFADFDRECRLIDNSGALDIAGNALVALIIEAASNRGRPQPASALRSTAIHE